MIRLQLCSPDLDAKGIPFAEWVELPQSEAKLTDIISELTYEAEQLLTAINPEYTIEGLFICDYDCDLEVDLDLTEGDDVFALNEIAKSLEMLLPFYSEEVICTVIQDYVNLEDAIYVLQTGNFDYLEGVYDEQDLGFVLADGLVEDSISIYFDYRSFGSDLLANGWMINELYGVAVLYRY